MTALAARTGAINLGQGFPDQDGPASVIEAAVAALRGGENQYAPLPGVPALREAVCDAPARVQYGLEPEDLLVTFGATEAIAAALLGAVRSGRRGRRARALLRLVRRLHRVRRRGSDGR